MGIVRNVYSSLMLLLLFCSAMFFPHITSAHALFPQEVVEYIEKNPDITDEELNSFFLDTYGYGLEEYFEQDSVKKTLYSDEFDVFAPSEEYLSLQEKEVLSQDVQNTLNIFTEKVQKNIFLEQALSLKNKGKEDSFWTQFKNYVVIGVDHILSGTDHILFVLSLLLLPFALSELFLLICVFTVSHSLTIVLAGLNILTLSSTIVEPIIAFSIAVTIITAMYLNIRGVQTKNFSLHIAIIFIFGLFHGLGFAGAFSLLNIDSENYIVPLLSMNIGVELGQLFIIMIGLPLVWIMRNQKHGIFLLNAVSVIILFFSIFWLIERL